MRQHTSLNPIIAAITLFGSSAAYATDTRVARNLDGVWMVTTTPRDCTTGLEFPQAAFEALFTFQKGGKISAGIAAERHEASPPGCGACGCRVWGRPSILRSTRPC